MGPIVHGDAAEGGGPPLADVGWVHRRRVGGECWRLHGAHRRRHVRELGLQPLSGLRQPFHHSPGSLADLGGLDVGSCVRDAQRQVRDGIGGATGVCLRVCHWRVGVGVGVGRNPPPLLARRSRGLGTRRARRCGASELDPLMLLTTAWVTGRGLQLFG